ncbi:hypothetical protein Tco_0924585 [Tanacetum coccineum]|uniref:Ubiquitin-like protease family profile domain-containing protein n=1 Tax=Tanacetum coccineum TaxID=301880 RepID=A0ABQ5D488_9ASTR
MSVSAEHRILTLGCRTTNNSIDCGVFVMRHMETYRGEGDRGDRCCLKEEGTGQQGQINELRYKGRGSGEWARSGGVLFCSPIGCTHQLQETEVHRQRCREDLHAASISIAFSPV